MKFKDGEEINILFDYFGDSLKLTEDEAREFFWFDEDFDFGFLYISKVK